MTFEVVKRIGIYICIPIFLRKIILHTLKTRHTKKYQTWINKQQIKKIVYK